MGVSSNSHDDKKKRTDLAARSVSAMADDYARMMLPIISELRAVGITSARGLARELTRRGIAAARGGRWTARAVQNLLARLAWPRSERSPNEMRAVRRAEGDARDRNAAFVVAELHQRGVTNLTALARELNARAIPGRRNGVRWEAKMVRALLARRGLRGG